MKKQTNDGLAVTVPIEIIQNKIYLIRGQKVMLDRDLAELYGVETKRLNEQVKRNFKRFPLDFMFQLTKQETQNWMSQFATSNRHRMGVRKMPFVFTQEGVAMLSSVLNSDRAIEVNIQIMRVFSKIREMISSHKDLKRKIEDLERKFTAKFSEHDQKFILIFQAIKQLMSDKEEENNKRGPLGFQIPKISSSQARGKHNK